LIAAEESGSIAIRGHIPERDGVLLSLLLTEIAASAKRPMSEVVKQLLADVGPHVYHRRDIQLAERIEVVSRLRKDPPENFGGLRVVAVDTLDGVKLRFKDGWLLFRALEDEPILRLYCEMDKAGKVDNLLSEAAQFAKGDIRLF